MLWLIDRFGWDAAHSGPVGEMRRMLAAENVYKSYQGRENYRDKDGGKNWAEWAGNYPQAAELLNRAAQAASEEQTDDGNS